jgi:hypothetical protein
MKVKLNKEWCMKKAKAEKSIKLNLVTTNIELAEPASKEFRKALKVISGIYAKNKHKHDDRFRVTKSIQDKIIELSKNLKVFRPLKARWTIDTEQELKSYHGIEVGDEVAKMVAGEFKRQYGN